MALRKEPNKPSETGGIIYRRFRKGKNGKVYDAWDYGYKAWPIPVKFKRNKR